jgi:hypothetical protein
MKLAQKITETTLTLKTKIETLETSYSIIRSEKAAIKQTEGDVWNIFKNNLMTIDMTGEEAPAGYEGLNLQYIRLQEAFSQIDIKEKKLVTQVNTLINIAKERPLLLKFMENLKEAVIIQKYAVQLHSDYTTKEGLLSDIDEIIFAKSVADVYVKDRMLIPKLVRKTPELATFWSLICDKKAVKYLEFAPILRGAYAAHKLAKAEEMEGEA